MTMQGGMTQSEKARLFLPWWRSLSPQEQDAYQARAGQRGVPALELFMQERPDATQPGDTQGGGPAATGPTITIPQNAPAADFGGLPPDATPTTADQGGAQQPQFLYSNWNEAWSDLSSRVKQQGLGPQGMLALVDELEKTGDIPPQWGQTLRGLAREQPDTFWQTITTNTGQLGVQPGDMQGGGPAATGPQGPLAPSGPTAVTPPNTSQAPEFITKPKTPLELTGSEGGRFRLFEDFLAGNQRFQSYNPLAQGFIREQFDPLQAYFQLQQAADPTGGANMSFRDFVSGDTGTRLNPQHFMNAFQQVAPFLTGGASPSVEQAGALNQLESNAPNVISQFYRSGVNPFLQDYVQREAQRRIGAFRDQNPEGNVFLEFANRGFQF